MLSTENQRFVKLLERLKSERIVFNDSDFAKRVGVTRSYVSEVKNGNRSLTEQFALSVADAVDEANRKIIEAVFKKE